jgi:hypothetical protein
MIGCVKRIRSLSPGLAMVVEVTECSPLGATRCDGAPVHQLARVKQRGPNTVLMTGRWGSDTSNQDLGALYLMK